MLNVEMNFQDMDFENAQKIAEMREKIDNMKKICEDDMETLRSMSFS